MDLRNFVLDDVARAPAFILLYLVLFLLSKWLKGVLRPYDIDHELATKDNHAVALATSGYYLATAVIYCAALIGPSNGLREDLIAVGGYALLGLVMLNFSGWFADLAILRKFCDTKQLIQEKNAGVGAAHFGIYLATGLIAAGAVSGEGGGVVSAIVFFILGQISLLVFGFVYERLSPYDIHEQLQNRNTAAGIAFGGHIIALAIIVMNAAAGNFIDWKSDLAQFGLANLIAFIFLPVIRLVVDRLVIPGQSLAREIRDDRNVGAGILEATSAIAFAAVLAFLL
ncbi:MAG TPA: DUF350 domain-containing protein [Ensifer sp.]|jgi:uncharacterized membrane protein YjfL (UPF0719 family)|uniref:DUF350 domain-containing protein n=1 Tax=Ensifer sp. TaxID=1872086 RepID=UPI002E0EE4BA|nr:DUF350 domain-containing protein [Ensifer sp.]